MNKDEWLNETFRVDIHGRELNIKSSCMTYMTRRKIYNARGYTLKQINRMWKLGKEN